MRQIHSAVKRIPVLVGITLVLTLLAAAAAAAGGRHIPRIAASSKTEDDYYIFLWGQGSSTREAEQDAITRVVDRLGPFVPRVEISRRIKRVPGVDPVRERGTVYIYFAFPKNEINTITRRIDFGRQLSWSFQSAQAAFNKGESENAESLIVKIIDNYNEGLGQEFVLEQAHMLAGDVYGHRGLNRPHDARRHYRVVRDSRSQDPTISSLRRDAIDQLRDLDRNHPEPLAWPLKDRWRNGPVGLLALVKEGGEYRPADLIISSIGGYLGEAGIAYQDITARARLAGAGIAEGDSFNPEIAGILQNDLKVFLGVVLEIDPDKYGKTREIRGMQIPVENSSVRWYLVYRPFERIVLRDGRSYSLADYHGEQTSIAQDLMSTVVNRSPPVNE